MSNERFKFRVWDKEEKKYSGYTLLLDRSGELDNLSWDGDLLETDPNRFTIEQCTGLRDKNGRLIFEGDVLGYADKASIVVEWDCKNANFLFTQISDGLDEYIFRVVKLEIIGNIHEMELEK